jgi:hypothetical protein
MSETISKQEIIQFQQEWGDKIVHIGKLFLEGKDYKQATIELVEQLYAFNEGSVLFKPTRAAKRQFRATKEGAISYFIGDNDQFPEDSGFALNPWIKVRFENYNFILDESMPISMGRYFFTDPMGKEKHVEYTIGYIRSEENKIKIKLHHSSVPFRKQ